MDESTAAKLAQMDKAADAAVTELEHQMATDPEVEKAVQIVGGWMKRNYEQAGYKRLSKALMALSMQPGR